MKIFFDTEFTGLHKNTTLISIGLVDENGRSFYAEFTDYDENQCDDWIKENVIKHLEYNDAEDETTEMIVCDIWRISGNKEFVKEHLIEWLKEYDTDIIELVSDVCHYDMVLFIDIFGTPWDLPGNLNPACHDINQDIAMAYMISEREAFDRSREEILEEYNYEIKGDKHNALYDAKVIQAIYNILESQIGIIG